MKKLYIWTFDAGYENGYTNLLLDTLKNTMHGKLLCS